MELTIIQKIAVAALPIILAITIHEAAHGYAARYFGDRTAEKLGRITLNPLKHIDLFGTIILPTIAITLSGFLFGWAKPVPVVYSNLRNPSKNMLWVAAAGPASNLVMAIIWAILLGLAPHLPVFFGGFLGLMATVGISINIVLMVLNLLPMPPLDGGRIAVSLLPMPYARQLAQVEQYGFYILIALAMTGLLDKIISPFIHLFEALIVRIFV